MSRLGLAWNEGSCVHLGPGETSGVLVCTTPLELPCLDPADYASVLHRNGCFQIYLFLHLCTENMPPKQADQRKLKFDIYQLVQ